MASGLSVRFGQNKLFAKLEGKTFLERILDTTEGVFARRVVVTRSEEAAEFCRKKGVEVIFHSLPHRNDTVRLGTAYMEGMDGVLFCPCDQPLLRKESLLRLLEAFQEGNILRLAYGGKTGMPVLFDKRYFAELHSLPEKKGGSYLIGKYQERVKTIQAREEFELYDVDTPKDLEILQVYCAKNKKKKEENSMKLMKTEEAVGQILCHDITQIIKGVTKDAVFRKGHIIREEDIPVLLSVGKDHIYIWENNENMLHENDAAQILYDICKNENMHPSEVKEGKIEVIADCDGLLKIDREILQGMNALGEMMIASRHGDFPVRKGEKIAGTRIIPLVIEKEKMEKAKQVANGKPIFEIKPFLKKKVGIVATGNEVFYGRIEDTFTPVIEEKLAEYGTEVIGRMLSNDDSERIEACIRELLEQGADMIICTGGMSVDPDDRTPAAIRRVAEEVVTYGAPVLPGAMFLLAYGKGDIPIMGLPGCVMYARRTIFDLVLPRVLAEEKLRAEDFYVLGEGGLCLSCPICTFPNCGFGK